MSDGRQLSREFTIFFGFWNGETVRHLKIDNTWSFEERRNSSQINGVFSCVRLIHLCIGGWGKKTDGRASSHEEAKDENEETKYKLQDGGIF